MTIRMTATEAKAKLLSVLDEVATGQEVEITKRGKPVARLVPPPPTARLEGLLRGMAVTTCGEDELFGTGEVWEAS